MKDDWVARIVDEHNPEIGRVRDVYADSLAPGEYVMDVILYSADGERLGRTSPAMGGPRGFEPAVPCKEWRRIAEPAFPLERVGPYRDYKPSLTVLENRSGDSHA